MARVPLPKSGTAASTTGDSPAAPNANAARPPVRRGFFSRWFRRGILLLLIVAPVVWFAPDIIARTDLRQRLVPALVPNFRGTLELGPTQLGWLQPVDIRNGRLVDQQHVEVLRFQRLTSDEALWKLLLQPAAMGRLVLTSPVVTVRVRDDGSNWEELMAVFFENRVVTAHRPFGVELEVRSGTIEISHDRLPNDVTELSPINATAVVQDGKLASCQVTGVAHRPAVATESLPPAFSITYGPLAALNSTAAAGSPTTPDRAGADRDPSNKPLADPPKTGDALTGPGWALTANALDLNLLKPLLARWIQDATIEGELHGQLQLQLPAAQEWRTRGALHGSGFSLTGLFGHHPVHGPDRLQFQQLKADFDVQQVANVITVHQGEFGTDWLDGHLLGDFVRPTSGQGWQPQVTAAVFADRDYEASLRADLAVVGKLFPGLLQLHEDLIVTGGRLTLAAASRPLVGIAKSTEDASSPKVTPREWTGSASLTQLQATRNGRVQRWDTPVRLQFAADRRQDKLVVRQAEGTADFFHIAGQGDARSATMQAECDLDRLAAELSKFIQLGDWKLGGTLKARGQLRDEADDAVSVQLTSRIQQLHWGPRSEPLWQEPQLECELSGLAILDDHFRPQTVRSGRLQVTAGTDRLIAEIPTPTDASQNHEGEFQLNLTGDLARWQARSRPWVAWGDWQIAGQAQNTQLRGRYSPGKLYLEEARGDWKNVSCRNATWDIQEPQAEWSLQGVLSSQPRGINLSQVSWTGAAMVVQAHDVVYAVRPEKTKASGSAASSTDISGQVEFKADLAKVSVWRRFDPRQPALAAAGIAVGRGTLAQTESKLALSAEVDVQNPTIVQWPGTAPRPAAATFNLNGTGGDGGRPNGGPPARQRNQPAAGQWQVVYREPKWQGTAKLQFNQTDSALAIQQVVATGENWRVDLQGSIQDLQQSMRADLQGNLRFDWDGMTRAATDNPYHFQASGTSNQPFHLQGPLASGVTTKPAATPSSTTLISQGRGSSDPQSPPVMVDADAPPYLSPKLAADGGVDWQSLHLLGWTIGAGKLAGRLDRGVLRIEPLAWDVSGGQLQLEPTIDCRGPSPHLTIPAGRHVNQVQLTPQLADGWLKYVAPILAEATTMQGTFSLDSTGIDVDLQQPQVGAASGQLRIHQAEVGPGRLTAQLFEMVRILQTLIGRGQGGGDFGNLIDLPDQTVQYQWANSAVTHEGLRMIIRGLEIRTSGTVRLDNEQLELVAEIPLRDDWTAEGKPLARMRGKSLQLMIGGTLNNPQLDQRTLLDLARQAATAPLEEKLDDLLKKPLDRLFGK